MEVERQNAKLEKLKNNFRELINKINIIYPLINDSTFLHNETEEQLISLIRLFKQKFETRFG